ncbi:MAG: hypothetical protein WD178_08900 [Actinomycetota bacterium]
MSEIYCPKCGSDARLSGQRRGSLIRITCSGCNLVWDRDPSPRCPHCGSEEVRPVPEAVWAKSRGNQMSIVAYRTVYACPTCDADRLKAYLSGASPVPPDKSSSGI